MIGKTVMITRGEHCGKVGQVLDSIVFPQVKEPVWCVYLGGTVTVPCCQDELEVII